MIPSLIGIRSFSFIQLRKRNLVPPDCHSPRYNRPEAATAVIQ